MTKISEKTVVTVPLTKDDRIVVQVGGQTHRAPARRTLTEATTPYVAVLTDTDGYIRLSDGDAETEQVVFTVPANADVAIPILGTLTVECLSAGGMSIAGDVGVTVNPSGSGLYVLYQNGVAVLTKVGTNEWTCVGAQVG